MDKTFWAGVKYRSGLWTQHAAPTLQKARGKPSLRLPAPHPLARRAGVRAAGGTVIMAPSIGGASWASCPPGARGAAGHDFCFWVRTFSVEAQWSFPAGHQGSRENWSRARDGPPGPTGHQVPERALFPGGKSATYAACWPCLPVAPECQPQASAGMSEPRGAPAPWTCACRPGLSFRWEWRVSAR